MANANSAAQAGAGTSGANTDASGSGDLTPPWHKLLTVQNTVGGALAPPIGLIAIWDGTLASIPPRWVLCDGNAGTPNLSSGKYVRGASGSGEVGNTGGAASHTHGASAGHIHAGGGTAHSHGATSSGDTNATRDPSSGGQGAPWLVASSTTVDATHDVAATDSVADPAPGSASAPASSADSTEPLHTAVAYVQYTG